jgi:hypothetical protein
MAKQITIVARIVFEIHDEADETIARETAIEALHQVAAESVLLTHMPDDTGREIVFDEIHISDRAIRID